MQKGADSAAAAATTSHRAKAPDMPSSPLATAATRAIEADVTTMIPARRSASSTSSRRRRRSSVAAVAAGRRARSSSSQLPYSAANVWIGRGSLRSTQAAIGSDARIIQGVNSVVRAETATATG